MPVFYVQLYDNCPNMLTPDAVGVEGGGEASITLWSLLTNIFLLSLIFRHG
jgi:hypothetical protein